MRIWIICSGESAASEPQRCGAEEYADLCAKRLRATVPAEGMRCVEANGRKLYISPRGAAHGTAALLVSGASGVCEPLLELARHSEHFSVGHRRHLRRERLDLLDGGHYFFDLMITVCTENFRNKTCHSVSRKL